MVCIDKCTCCGHLKIIAVLVCLTLLNACRDIYRGIPATIGPVAKPPASGGSGFKNLGKDEILKTLFDNPLIDSSGAAVWEPDYKDAMDLPVSFDGKCHTNIDTIMFFTDTRNRNCAAVVFTTYNYVKRNSDSGRVEIAGSHFSGVSLGIALFKKPVGEDWEIYAFRKRFSELGFFGTYRTGREDHGEICLKEIGDKWTCLSLKQGIGGSGGISYGYESLYAIEEFQMGRQQPEDEVQEWYNDYLLQNILTYNYHYAGYAPEGTARIERSAAINIVKKKSNYYSIRIDINKNGKASAETYLYNEAIGKYLPAQSRKQ